MVLLTLLEMATANFNTKLLELYRNANELRNRILKEDYGGKNR